MKFYSVLIRIATLQTSVSLKQSWTRLQLRNTPWKTFPQRAPPSNSSAPHLPARSGPFELLPSSAPLLETLTTPAQNPTGLGASSSPSSQLPCLSPGRPTQPPSGLRPTSVPRPLPRVCMLLPPLIPPKGLPGHVAPLPSSPLLSPE